VAFTRAFGKQACAAVPANIMEASQYPVPAAQRKELPAGDVDRQVVLRLRDSGGGPQHLPMALKYGLALRFVQTGVDVEVRAEIGELGHREHLLML